MKLKLLPGFAVLAMTAPTFAQTEGDQQWTLLASDKNVSVYYEQGTCGTSEMVFVRIVNNNTTAVNVDWTLFEGGKGKHLEVKAGETITGSCENRPRVFMLAERMPAGKSLAPEKVHVEVSLTK